MKVWTINYLLSQCVPITHSCSSHWSHGMNNRFNEIKMRLVKENRHSLCEWICLGKSHNQLSKARNYGQNITRNE